MVDIKNKQIEELLKKPFSVGDKVDVTIDYIEKKDEYVKEGRKKVKVIVDVPKVFTSVGDIISIEENGAVDVSVTESKTVPTGINYSYVGNHTKVLHVNIKNIRHNLDNCGVNPFSKETYRIDFYNIDIESLMMRVGYDYSMDRDNNTIVIVEQSSVEQSYRRASMNPFVVGDDGVKNYYQRDYVWDENDKKLLIDSIYHGIEIGKFLFRYNSWNRIKKYEGEVTNFDCVDGKQRLNAIIQFLTNQVSDMNGYYWKDLSIKAQRRFLRYSNLSFGQLSEDASDKDVINCFLSLNFTGKMMSQEHIDYVKKINI